jgi:hypothetical protein
VKVQTSEIDNVIRKPTVTQTQNIICISSCVVSEYICYGGVFVVKNGIACKLGTVIADPGTFQSVWDQK